MIKIFLRKLVAFLVDVKELDEKGIEVRNDVCYNQ